MTEYRKMGTRMFFKISDGNMIRILNKAKLSVVTVFFQNDFMIEETLEEAFPCTEQEFNEQYQIALERIKTKIL
jgi:hypothetical protein